MFLNSHSLQNLSYAKASDTGGELLTVPLIEGGKPRSGRGSLTHPERNMSAYSFAPCTLRRSSSKKFRTSVTW